MANKASIQIDRGAGVALNEQVAAAFRDAIRCGGLKAGERLPAARGLAADLGVNPVTVVTAYRKLSAEGLVCSRVGSGTYVAAGVVSRSAEPDASGFMDLSERHPAARLIPVGAVRRLMDLVVDRDGAAAFGYDDIGGYGPLRRALSDHLRGSGMEVNASELVVVSGAQQGLHLLLDQYVERGDCVVVERPSYPGMLRLLSRCGVQIEAVDLTPEGMDLTALERVLRSRPVRMVYAMPVYQYPTGLCYSEACCRRLRELCQAHGVLLVEDDSLSDLDFGLGRSRPARALSGTTRGCVYIKSFSQVFVPGFRLAVCAADAGIAAALRTAKQGADLFTSGLFQRVLELFLTGGGYDQHIRTLESVYRPLFEAVLTRARSRLTPLGFTIASVHGGTSLWLRLPDHLDPEAFHRETVRCGISLAPGDPFSTDGSTAGGTCLCFGRLTLADLDRVLDVLEDIVS